jgi:type II secretory pathway pseudopilin PulG
MLIAVIVMVALVLIALSVAAPVVARDLRRDKEVESEHRAQQYVRAIRLYTKKGKGPYPASLETLEKSNNVRYLRKQYIDPLTGKADWRIIHVGENQTTVKGFFGEPLSGLDTKGAGAGLGSAATLGTGMGAAGSAGAASGATPALGAGFSGSATSPTVTAGAAGTGAGAATGTPTGTPAGTSAGTPAASLGSGGAGAIMGVGSSRSGASILTPNEQETYDTWEFLYDPRIELMYAKGQLGGGIGSQPATGVGTPASGLGSPAGTSPTPTPTGTPAR